MITIRPLLAAGALVLSATLAALAQETIPPVESPAASAPVETAPATPPPPTAAAPAAAPDAASPPAAQAAPALSDAPAMPASGTDEQGNDATLEPILPHDLSPWGMFMAADIVVKAVMIGLAFASFVTWTVWLAKSLELLGARRRGQRACAVVVRVRSLNEAQAALAGRGGVVPLLVQAARQEAELSEAALGHAGGAGLKERVASRLARIEAQAGRRMTRGTGLLATIGSTAPFVGLFGTVWGIMNAFIGISKSQTTNLAVVAPGIAEALLATALGLVAAIPAVVIYNMFARSITGYRQILSDASAGVERLVSRDLDYRSVSKRALAAE